jgi:hypothetical protein
VRVEDAVAVLADGTRVPCAGGRSDGRATLMLRPESLHIGAAGSAPDGAVGGKALQSSFLGSYVRVAVECSASSAPLMVALPGSATVAPDPDAAVAVWWAPEDAILLEPESTA